MPSLPLDKVLASVPQVRKDGAAYVIPEELDGLAYVALGHDVLQIPRLARVEVGTELVLHTFKGERFYFWPDQVVGFRFGGPEAKAKSAGAGFVKG